jgi:hydroxyacylglutathione hydrolase
LSLEIVTFVNGRWRQNCYVVGCDRDALIIDPGSQAGEISALVEGKGWRVHAILNTHGHYDHIGAVADLVDRYQVPFYLHRADETLLKRANLYRILFGSQEPIRVPSATHDVATLPPTFRLDPFVVSWLATPGHTEGSVCFRIDDFLFSGDTLMRSTIGRTDLPGANRPLLLDSLRRLTTLPGDIVVCGGHGPRTILSAEFAPGATVWSLLQ